MTHTLSPEASRNGSTPTGHRGGATMTEPHSLLLNALHWAMLAGASTIAPALIHQRGYQTLPLPEDSD